MYVLVLFILIIFQIIRLAFFNPNINEVLTSNLQTQGYDMLAGSKNICNIYRIYLKVMITLCPKAIIAYHKGKTTLFQINSHRSNISVPKTLFWLEIVLL